MNICKNQFVRWCVAAIIPCWFLVLASVAVMSPDYYLLAAVIIMGIAAFALFFGLTIVCKMLVDEYCDRRGK